MSTKTVEPRSSSDLGRIADSTPIGIEISIQMTAATIANDSVTGKRLQISESTERCFANELPKRPSN